MVNVCLRVLRFYTVLRFHPLKSHKKSHNFQDTPNDMCDCNLYFETSNHYLLHCPIFVEQRRELFLTLYPILLANNMRFLDDNNMVRLLLYGLDKLALLSNQTFLTATIKFIRKTSRFSSIQV